MRRPCWGEKGRERTNVSASGFADDLGDRHGEGEECCVVVDDIYTATMGPEELVSKRELLEIGLRSGGI